MRFEPHAYQEDVIRRVCAQDRLALFLDPGLGKTSIALEAFRRLRMEMDVSRMLVVAPLRPCYTVWPREAQKWDAFRGLKVHVLHGPGRVAAALEGDADVIVVNPEGLEWLKDQEWPERRRPEMLVVDESTKFKRSSTERSKNLWRVIKRLNSFQRRYVLTGTPSPNGVQDLHGQVLILDEGKRLGRTLKDFRNSYCVSVQVSENHHDWEARSDAPERVRAMIQDVSIRLSARDHLDLPELVRVTVPIELPADAREKYETLERDLFLEMSLGELAAVNAGALTAKCRQLAAGSVYVTDPDDPSGKTRHVEVVHEAKAEALGDLVDEMGGDPLLVAYAHDHDVAAIERVLGRSVPRIGGGVSAKKGEQIESEWNAGLHPVLLVHPASGGHGLNLQEGGGHVAWYSLPWDLELYDQFNGRLFRQGQRRERVVIHHLTALDTIDEVMVETLDGKSHNQEALLDALKRGLGARA